MPRSPSLFTRRPWVEGIPAHERQRAAPTLAAVCSRRRVEPIPDQRQKAPPSGPRGRTDCRHVVDYLSVSARLSHKDGGASRMKAPLARRKAACFRLATRGQSRPGSCHEEANRHTGRRNARGWTCRLARHSVQTVRRRSSLQGPACEFLAKRNHPLEAW